MISGICGFLDGGVVEGGNESEFKEGRRCWYEDGNPVFLLLLGHVVSPIALRCFSNFRRGERERGRVLWTECLDKQAAGREGRG